MTQDREEIYETLDDLCGDILLTQLMVRGSREGWEELRAFPQSVSQGLMCRLMDHCEQHVMELHYLLHKQTQG